VELRANALAIAIAATGAGLRRITKPALSANVVRQGSVPLRT
jgi:hypothetical protein